MCDHMKPSKARRRTLIILFIAWWLLAAAIATVFILAPSARADDGIEDYLRGNGYLICQIITNSPDRTTVNGAVVAIEADGFTRQEASDIVWASVTALCPQWESLLKNVVAQNSRQNERRSERTRLV